ncbi:MAG: glycosyltransferase [Sphingobacteriaceae bacterium]|jgi:biofilm PGA synthesis N-glycosyltransferase PgaC|nr:glycosyltransferase [Sphingobacteriaceae bacterium]
MTEALDDFFGYISIVGPGKLIRIFWFFVFFEFLRFFLFELTTLVIWYLGNKTRKLKYQVARRKLFIDRPLVSIIVPGKNEGEHIYKLVMSMKEQTYTNYEFIVVDDGSDDDTEAICKSLQKNGFIDLFLRNDVRGGKASAANLGLRYSSGKLIVHLDADCSYDNDAIEKIIIPFYLDDNIGAVGGNILVRNYKDSLCATLQAIEYADTISVGRITSSYLGIYRVVSGAFGAFKKEALDRVGGWDIGPGLDGDITVKLRKLDYKIEFEPEAICQTNVPNTFRKLVKQRLRWDKSIIRFRVRKHRDVFFPNSTFKFSNFISSFENITYNLVLNFKWWVYAIDMTINYPSILLFIIPFNILLYTITNFLKFLIFSLFRVRKNEQVSYFLIYLPCMVFYFGLYLRIVRTIAYVDELFFKRSYEDNWNPSKSSAHAKELGL